MKSQKSVQITIPVYNEEKTLEKSIDTLMVFCQKSLSSYNWHITIADNASVDNTPVIGATLAKKYEKVSLFRLEQKGRGRAIKRIWSQSQADYCCYMDVDLSTELKHLPKLLEALDRGYDIAIDRD
jgi:glycosyltransferase involved in cell wall biosynthesis